MYNYLMRLMLQFLHDRADNDRSMTINRTELNLLTDFIAYYCEHGIEENE